MRTAIIAIATLLTISLAFGLGRWTAPRHTAEIATAPARPAPARTTPHAQLGIGSCSAKTEPTPPLATRSDQRIALDP